MLGKPEDDDSVLVPASHIARTKSAREFILIDPASQPRLIQ
jgi:hypothetical protein